jgi:indole-3-glycerol phosphate synthase
MRPVAETVLDRIVAGVRRRLAEASPPADLEAMATEAVEQRRTLGLRSLAAGLRRPGPQILAECKHASPSAGVIRTPFDPVHLARSYEAAGAAGISVVVEPEFFQGDPGWLPAVRSAVSLPVLRKDFIIDERQLFDTALRGADAVLLIQRILSPEQVSHLLAVARDLELEVLLEIFADEEPEPAVASGAEILGVNARDLATFEVRLDRVEELADALPADRVRVAESGISNGAVVQQLRAAGYDAFLVGEHLVRADDPGAALRALRGDE